MYTLKYEIISEEEKTCKVVGCDGTNEYYDEIVIPEYAKINDIEYKVIGIDVKFITISAGRIFLPKSLHSIEEFAFGCCNFKSVSLPEGLGYIHRGAFMKCNYLEQITIPYSVSRIEQKAFYTN